MTRLVVFLLTSLLCSEFASAQIKWEVRIALLSSGGNQNIELNENSNSFMSSGIFCTVSEIERQETSDYLQEKREITCSLGANVYAAVPLHCRSTSIDPYKSATLIATKSEKEKISASLFCTISQNQAAFQAPTQKVTTKKRLRTNGERLFDAELRAKELQVELMQQRLRDGRSTCCKVCDKGQPCGDTCIASNLTCRKPPGCACY